LIVDLVIHATYLKPAVVHFTIPISIETAESFNAYSGRLKYHLFDMRSYMLADQVLCVAACSELRRLKSSKFHYIVFVHK